MLSNLKRIREKTFALVMHVKVESTCKKDKYIYPYKTCKLKKTVNAIQGGKGNIKMYFTIQDYIYIYIYIYIYVH